MHSAAAVEGILYVFGGLNQLQQASCQLHSLCLTRFEWKSLGELRVDGSPVRMCGHSSTATSNQVLLFGGLDPESGTIYNQLFVFYTGDKNWGRHEQRSSPRFCGSMCVLADGVYLVGGCNLVNRTVPRTEKIDLENMTIELLGE